MRLLTTCFAITFAILLSACSTTGPKYHTIKDSTPQLESEKGRIYFYRNSGFVGGGLRPNIRLNDEIVGESKPGGFFFVDRKSGDMKVATATEIEKQLTFQLEAGQTRYVKTSVSLGLLVGRIQPELVDNETGEKEIQELSYTGSPLPQAIDKP